MNDKKNIFSVLVIVIFTILSGYCSAGEEIKMVTGTNKDAVVHAECINTSTGLAVGFRIEIINPSTDKNLVLVARDDISQLFYVRLINEKGLDVSPMRNKRRADKRGFDTPLKYEIILPGTSRSWFIPVPSQVRVDFMKLNANNLASTPNGKYMAEIIVTVKYFMQDKGKKSIPKFPEFQYLQLTLPRISIVVDSKLLGQNIEYIYRCSSPESFF